MLEKKKKELLTVENIKQDLLALQRRKREILLEWRLCSTAIPYGIISLCMFIPVLVMPDVPEAKIYRIAFIVFGLIPLMLMFYQLAKLLDTVFVVYKKENALIEKADFTVYEDTLKKIEEAWIYEPHGSRYSMNHKTVYMYHFSDDTVRLYNLKRHYAWSKDFYLSTPGVEQTSLEGDEFYLVRMNTDKKTVYFYNKKFFDYKG